MTPPPLPTNITGIVSLGLYLNTVTNNWWGPLLLLQVFFFFFFLYIDKTQETNFALTGLFTALIAAIWVVMGWIDMIEFVIAFAIAIIGLLIVRFR